MTQEFPFAPGVRDKDSVISCLGFPLAVQIFGLCMFQKRPPGVSQRAESGPAAGKEKPVPGGRHSSCDCRACGATLLPGRSSPTHILQTLPKTQASQRQLHERLRQGREMVIGNACSEAFSRASVWFASLATVLKQTEGSCSGFGAWVRTFLPFLAAQVLHNQRLTLTRVAFKFKCCSK